MKQRKHRKHRKAEPYLTLALLTVFFCWLFVVRYGAFGAKVDWMSQHSVIPDYFRRQFYETGNLFPDFAANIGGGQNIYNFSYYGLYSPVILFSYLFPFIKMSDYVMIASVISLASSVMLFYKWLQRSGISPDIRFLTSVCFLLAGPMIFHSYGHIMFVNYMPFLCLAFLGIDDYFERKKIGLYTISVFLMILTSFYFSIGGMLVLVLYGVYRYLQVKEKSGESVNVSGFLMDGIRFLLPMITAVLMSGILLIPTAMALTGKRGAAQVSVGSLLTPNIPISRLVYDPYGIGLTTLVMTVLITGVAYRKWSEKFLHIGCITLLTVPLFAYLLNGGLYVRDKVMIPFLPLLCYLIAHYLEKQKRHEISFVEGCLPYLLTIVWVYAGHNQKGYERYWKWIVIDAIIMVITFLVFYWKRCVRILILVPVIFLILYGCTLHKSADRITEQEFYHQVTNQNIECVIREIVREDDGLYRMEQLGTERENEADINRIWDMGQYVSSIYSSSYNAGYDTFRKETFLLEQPFRNFLMQPAVRNPVFQRFMGVKYLVSEQEIPGYEVYKTMGDIHVYQNDNVSPIAYATNQVISEQKYEKLDFPYNQMALLNAAVVKDGEEAADLEETVSEVPLTETGYRIHTKKPKTVKIPIPEAKEGAVLFLQFDVKNSRPSKDVSIWLNGSRNKLTSENHIYYNGNTTFHYAIALEKGQREVMLKFGKGNYEIWDMKCYVGSFSQGNKLYQSEFVVDKAKTKGNKIVGTIDAINDGYFITTIPYDSAFEVKVDGKQVQHEKVNTAFLGMEMDEGNHEIEIIYHAPGVNVGKWVSIVGMILFLVLKKLY